MRDIRLDVFFVSTPDWNETVSAGSSLHRTRPHKMHRVIRNSGILRVEESVPSPCSSPGLNPAPLDVYSRSLVCHLIVVLPG